MEHPSHAARSAAKAHIIKTRDQLLSEINLWLKKHGQATWTRDELIGRMASEFLSFRKGDNPIAGPISDFLVCLIKDRSFNRVLKLRSKQISHIRFRKSGEQFTVPSHYSLAMDIIATEKDLRGRSFDWVNSNYIRIALATVLNPKESTRPSKRIARTDNATPAGVLDSVNLARKHLHLSTLTRNELVAVLSDKVAVLNDCYGPADPEVVSFLECFLTDSPFTTEIGVSEFVSNESIIADVTDERLTFAPNKSLEIYVREPVFPDSEATLSTKIVVSNYTPETKRAAKAH
jgi:hypothetical protein